MRLKIVLTLGAIAILAAVAAGCGGGSDSTSGSTTTADSGKATTTKSQTESKGESQGGSKAEAKPLTKSEFVVQINEICIQVPPGYKEKLKELTKGGKKLTKAETNLKAAVPPLYSAIEEMETVVPPKGEEQTLEEVISALENAAKGLEAEPTAELSGPSSPFAEFQAVTKKHGFQTCSGL